MRKAVIDVGSNSVLLTVGEWTGTGWRPVIETSAVTALGAGTKATGLLGESGIEGTLAALTVAFSRADMAGASQIVAAATMAARIARNTDEFLRRAEAQGTPVRVLSGEEEARLGLISVVQDPLFSLEPRLAIIDVGGHSTELAIAEKCDDHPGGWKELLRQSFSVGTLALIGGVLKDECPDGLAILRATKEIDEQIGLAVLPGRSGLPVALGATGTNLVSIRDHLAEWQPEKVHGAVLGYDEISLAASRLSSMPLAQRRGLVGMEPGREATLPSGALILERFLFAIKAERCCVSVRGWRHALLEELGEP